MPRSIGGSRWRGTWNGDEITERLVNAVIKGVDKTLEDAVQTAKATHPWQNRSGDLERSHRVVPARLEGTKVKGSWGVTEDYGFWLEVGTAYMSGFTWMRPASDVTFINLPLHIKSEY